MEACRLQLTDEEIEEFQKGVDATPGGQQDVPWNLPYDESFEIPKNKLAIGKEKTVCYSYKIQF
jgi:hypothetical protein